MIGADNCPRIEARAQPNGHVAPYVGKIQGFYSASSARSASGKIAVNEDGRRRKVTKLRVIVKQLLTRASRLRAARAT